jgi:hypothetical protein
MSVFHALRDAVAAAAGDAAAMRLMAPATPEAVLYALGACASARAPAQVSMLAQTPVPAITPAIAPTSAQTIPQAAT